MAITLEQPDACVHIEELSNGKRRLSVRALVPSLFVSTSEWETTYPLALIEEIWRRKGAAYLCDEIRRDEDPSYVQIDLYYTLLGHLPASAFAGKRLLDFGCGSGASTIALARMLPQTQIVGLDIEEDLLSAARLRAQFHGLTNLTFQRSPDEAHLPSDLGEFDFVTLIAVVEHLLPSERRTILSQLWSYLKPGGVVFITQTPYRYSPIERHTTGLPLLNYLPDRLALAAARRFSKRVSPEETWVNLLRYGIRGTTVAEILGILRSTGAGEPVVLTPKELSLRSRIDLRIQLTRARGAYSRANRTKATVKRLLFRTMGMLGVDVTSVVSGLMLSIRKESR